MKLLTDLQVANLYDAGFWEEVHTKGIKKALEAQAEVSINEVFEEMEEHYGAPAGHPQAEDWGVAIWKEDLQALKQRLLGGE